MATYTIQDSTLESIGDAIRSKTGGTSKMSPSQMVTAINNLDPGGGGGGNVPSGGTTGQALVKRSDTDFDTEWATIQGGGGGSEIDDTAGAGDTDKAWSADKITTELAGKQATLPSGGTAGQVLGLNTQLEPEWTDKGGSGTITDVQVNGASVVSDGVANVPLASANNAGALLVRNGDNGLGFSQNYLCVHSAGPADVKAGTHITKPIVPYYQHQSVFYGLAKAAGDTTQSASSNAVGTYTIEAQAAIQAMLGLGGEIGISVVSLTGTTISQVGLANTMYICGEVASLTFTAPATGICAIRFDSGSTATVASFTGVTSWMNGFDPTTLEADTTYEINILNGVGCAVWV